MSSDIPDPSEEPTPCAYTEYTEGEGVADLPATGEDAEGLEAAVWDGLTLVVLCVGTRGRVVGRIRDLAGHYGCSMILVGRSRSSSRYVCVRSSNSSSHASPWEPSRPRSAGSISSVTA